MAYQIFNDDDPAKNKIDWIHEFTNPLGNFLYVYKANYKSYLTVGDSDKAKCVHERYILVSAQEMSLEHIRKAVEEKRYPPLEDPM